MAHTTRGCGPRRLLAQDAHPSREARVSDQPVARGALDQQKAVVRSAHIRGYLAHGLANLGGRDQRRDVAVEPGILHRLGQDLRLLGRRGGGLPCK